MKFFTAFFAVLLTASVSLFSTQYPFNDKFTSKDIKKLEAGEIVIKNIGKCKNASMIEKTSAVSDKVLELFNDLRPNYLAEIVYMIPLENNADIIEQADNVFSDISLYKEIIYTDEDTGKTTQLFPIADLISREDGDDFHIIRSHVKMDMLAPYDTELIINTTEDTFFFSQINQEPMKLGFVTAIKTTKMRAAICAFQYEGNWFVYALGGVTAPSIPFVRKKIEKQFIGRIRDFTIYYIKHFNIVR